MSECDPIDLDDQEVETPPVDGPQSQRVDLLHGMTRSHEPQDSDDGPCLNDCAPVLTGCQRLGHKADKVAACCGCNPSTCRAFVCCLGLLSVVIIIAIAVGVSAEENSGGTEDAPRGGVDADPIIPSTAVMLHLDVNDMIRRHVNNVAIAFVLRHHDTGDLVRIDCNHKHQRVERYSATTGRLLIGSYDGKQVGNGNVCSNHHARIDKTYYTAIKSGGGSAFVYFDTAEWTVVEEPSARFVDTSAWEPLHDCSALVDSYRIDMSQPLIDARLRDQDYARKLLQPMWTVSQASVTGGDVSGYNWGRFWDFYDRIYYNTNTESFNVVAEGAALPPLVPVGTTTITPHCSKASLIYDGIVDMCTELYMCSTQQVHSAPGHVGWDCFCLLQTFSFAVSRVSCLSQDAECFARMYAWARIWDTIPCHTIGTCKTGAVSLPIQVESNGLVTGVDEVVDFGCIELYHGGLQTYRDQL